MSALQKATRNSGRRRRAPTKSWHCIWLESAIRTLMGWVAVAHVGSRILVAFLLFEPLSAESTGFPVWVSVTSQHSDVQAMWKTWGNEYTLECILSKWPGCKL